VVAAGHHEYSDPLAVGHAWVARRPSPSGSSNVLLLDRYGDVVASGAGDYLAGKDMVEGPLAAMLARYTRRHLGGEGKPTVWLVEQSRIVSLTPSAALDALRSLDHDQSTEFAAVVVISG
jgi:hypothetical protein